MYRNNKNGKILNVLLGIIALFLIIFIIAWVVSKGSNTSNFEADFKNNLENIQETAKKYFANDLPTEIGDTNVLTLQDLYDLNLVEPVSYGKTACSTQNSYSSITKINANEYKVKTNLVCGSKIDNITEKISANTIVNDNNGQEIINDEKDNVQLDVDKNVTSKDGKSTDVVNCSGPICTFEEIPTKCTTTYTYEFVKRNVSCPNGYSLKNGTCAKTTIESIDATKKYTEETTKIVDAKVNTGGSHLVYTNPIVTPGTSTKVCDNGTLASNGYCYDYKERTASSSSNCPSGYTQNGNACYKYADLILSTSTGCPSGYTQNGNACYKYADPIPSTSTGCPSGYTQSGSTCYKTATAVKTYTAWGNPTSTYQTFTPESTYTNEYSKKVLVGTGIKAGKTIYTYSIYSRTSYYTCAVGTLGSDNRCYVYANPTSSTTYSCPSGYTQNGNICYKYASLQTITSTSCPSGYTKDGNKCYIKTNLQSTVSYSCPSGYTDNGSKCVKKTNPRIVTSETTYSCPSGYTKTGTGTNTKCSKTVTTADAYYCEDANARLVGNKCYVTIPATFIGYACPSSYTLNGSLCLKTTTETVSPIWSNVDYIYSKDNYIEGYQKTGVAKFVTKCTPIEEVHYK